MQRPIMCAGGVLFKNPKLSYSVHIMSRVQHMHKKLLSNWVRSVCHSGSKQPSVASLWCSAGCCTSFFIRDSTPAIYSPLRIGSDNLSFEQHFVILFFTAIFYCWLLLCLLRTLVFANLNVHGRYSIHLFYKCEQQGWGSAEIGHSSWIW